MAPASTHAPSVLLARHPELRTAGEATLATTTVGGIRRTGLQIAPGAHVAYALTIPEGALLGFEVGTLGADTGKSQLEIDLTRDGATKTVDTIPLLPRLEGLPREVALGAAGAVEIDLTNVGDLPAFLTEPAVYVPRMDRRVVLVVLADTLRRDRLGVYGGAPTAAIDAFAAQATVFDHAYTVAPWTLPAVRTILGGRWPDEWDPAEHLGTTMAKGGWFTALLAGSPYLGHDFGTDAGWSWHVQTDGQASVQVERLKELLSVVPDRDLFVVMHVMDAHVPYGEAIPGDPAPAGLDETFSHTSMTKALGAMNPDNRSNALAWLGRRYDAAVQGLDAALAPVLATLGPEDVAILVADHGEELGDHGGWEHGHTLTEELVHVPLIVKAPGMAPGHRADPFTLLDLAPTIEALAGVRTYRAPERLPAFGWMLYGDAQWGVVDGNEKSVLHGDVVAFDLVADPREERPARVNDLEAFRTTLERGLGRPVIWTWRIAAPLPFPARTKLAITRAAPFEDAWPGITAPVSRTPPPHVDGSQFQTSWMAGTIFPREIFLAPGGADARVSVSVDGAASVELTAGEPPGAIGTVGGIRIEHALQPRTKQQAPGVESERLKSLGYVE